MNILHVSTHQEGGAANSAIQLHKGLLKLGVKSHLLSLYESNKVTNSSTIYSSKNIFSRKILWYKHLKYQKEVSQICDSFQGFQKFSLPFSPYDITKTEEYDKCDIVNLHWVADFLDYDSFFKKCKKPVIWTLHDMNPFTSGYHYTEGFLFEKPSLRKSFLDIKEKSISNFTEPFQIVTPSKWLGDESRKSIFRMLPHRVISYSLDYSGISSLSKNECRQKLGLSKEALTYVFVSNNLENEIKGSDILFESIENLDDQERVFVIIGRNDKVFRQKYESENIKFLGAKNNLEEISEAFIASDAFLMPTRQDNLPNTIIEAHCCGTPVITFDVGGVPEMINKKNGVICGSPKASNLIRGIESFEKDFNGFSRLSIAKEARDKYYLENQAKYYMELYDEIL